MRPSPTSTAAGETLSLWQDLGMLYATAGEDGRKASVRGFAVLCVAATLVLLSAPAFGTNWVTPPESSGWTGPLLAALVPVGVGLVFGGGTLGWRWVRFSKERRLLSQALAAAGEDATRPTADGLGGYYDAQLVLLRSEYEYLRSRHGERAPRSTRLFEEAFGFASDDGFECGPLNLAPDTAGMRRLRALWEARLAARRKAGERPPALGLKEDRAYRVFPREMTVPMELATRSAYLSISCRMLRDRYGKAALENLPTDLRQRAHRDLTEYQALVVRR